MIATVFELPRTKKRNYIYIYINKDGNPSTISTRHVETNVNTQEENQNNKKTVVMSRRPNAKRAFSVTK